MKRIFALVLVFLLMFAAACTPADSDPSQSSSAQPSSSQSPNTSPAQPSSSQSTNTSPGGVVALPKPDNFNLEGFPIVNDQITLSIGIRQTAAEANPAEMEYFIKLQELTNIKLDFVVFPDANYMENFHLMMANGDYPDIWYGRGTANADITNYIKAGMFIGMKDLIENYAPNVKKMMDTEPHAWARFMEKDDLYGLPWLYNNVQEFIDDKWYINQTWLDQLNLQIPTTPAELRYVLEMFRDNDMNGNGDPNDEIPMTIWYEYEGLGSLYGPWGVVDNPKNHMMVVDGKLIYVPVQEGYKQGLQYWRDMYADGLLWNQAITVDYNTYVSLNAGENTIYGSFIRHVGNSVTQNVDRLYEYGFQQPLKGSDGKQLWKTGDTKPQTESNIFMITDKCKYPEAAIRLADYFCTEQGTLEFRFGYHAYNDDGTWYTTSYPEGMTRTSVCPGGNAFVWLSEELTRRMTFEDLNGANNRIHEHYIAHQKVYEPYQLKDYVPASIPMTNEEKEELSLYWKMIMDYTKEMEAKFLINAVDITTEWNNYIKTLNDMGLQKVMDIYQAAYTRMVSG